MPQGNFRKTTHDVYTNIIAKRNAKRGKIMQGETGPPYSSLAKRNAKKRETISQGETGPPDSSLEEPKKKYV